MHQQIADLIATIQPLVEGAAKIEDEVKVHSATIADLQTKLANGNALDADDVAALAEAAKQIAAVTGGLRDAAVKVAPAVDNVVAAIPPASQPPMVPSTVPAEAPAAQQPAPAPAADPTPPAA